MQRIIIVLCTGLFLYNRHFTHRDLTDSDVRPYGVHTMIQHIAFSSNGVNEHAKRQQMNLPAMLECAFKQGLRTAQFQPITGNKRSLLAAIQI